MKRLHRYSIHGFRLQLAPGRWRTTEIYFTFEGARIGIFHVEVFDDTLRFLGTVATQNLALDTQRDMRAFITKHRNGWHKVPANFLV